ncbi:uncharacterized protein LOC128483474 [Spea bombifrons]|uniref:uncharacterized protein LOC128483474 n=1 Tax=Spea bombifrons TaxID=233779 RepID=UPI002349FED7|nr:uncharacterized protein LOC128483474 [Spea bombifrons]
MTSALFVLLNATSSLTKSVINTTTAIATSPLPTVISTPDILTTSTSRLIIPLKNATSTIGLTTNGLSASLATSNATGSFTTIVNTAATSPSTISNNTASMMNGISTLKTLSMQENSNFPSPSTDLKTSANASILMTSRSTAVPSTSSRTPTSQVSDTINPMSIISHDNSFSTITKVSATLFFNMSIASKTMAVSLSPTVTGTIKDGILSLNTTNNIKTASTNTVSSTSPSAIFAQSRASETLQTLSSVNTSITIPAFGVVSKTSRTSTTPLPSTTGMVIPTSDILAFNNSSSSPVSPGSSSLNISTPSSSNPVITFGMIPPNGIQGNSSPITTKAIGIIFTNVSDTIVSFSKTTPSLFGNPSSSSGTLSLNISNIPAITPSNRSKITTATEANSSAAPTQRIVADQMMISQNKPLDLLQLPSTSGSSLPSLVLTKTTEASLAPADNGTQKPQTSQNIPAPTGSASLNGTMESLTQVNPSTRNYSSYYTSYTASYTVNVINKTTVTKVKEPTISKTTMRTTTRKKRMPSGVFWSLIFPRISKGISDISDVFGPFEFKNKNQTVPKVPPVGNETGFVDSSVEPNSKGSAKSLLILHVNYLRMTMEDESETENIMLQNMKQLLQNHELDLMDRARDAENP